MIRIWFIKNRKRKKRIPMKFLVGNLYIYIYIFGLVNKDIFIFLFNLSITLTTKSIRYVYMTLGL